MLMTPMTPKVMARPIAASRRTDEAESPYQRSCAAPHRASRVWIEERADWRRAPDVRVGRLLQHLVDQALRVAVAARLQRLDRAEAILLRTAVGRRDDRSHGEPESVGDARIALLGELGLQRRQRLGVPALEHVPGRREALLGIGVGERQRTDRAFDFVADGVVDAHLPEGVGAGDGFAGLRVDDRAGRRLVGDDVIRLVEQQTIVAERLQDRRGLRRRLRRQFGDRLLGLRKLVVEELGERVVERVGPGGRRTTNERKAQSARTLSARAGSACSFRAARRGASLIFPALGYRRAVTGSPRSMRAALLMRAELTDEPEWRTTGDSVRRPHRPSVTFPSKAGEGMPWRSGCGQLVSRRTCRS